MKIAHVGTARFNGIFLCNLLQKKGIDVNLFLSDDQLNYLYEIFTSIPKWVFVRSRKSKISELTVRLNNIFRLNKYDLIHARCTSPLWVQLANRPFIAQAVGSDLRELAQEKSIIGYWMRRGFKNAKTVLICQVDLLKYSEEYPNSQYFPLPTNIGFYTPIKETKKWTDTLLLFHPTNQEWDESRPLMKTSNGNDKIIRVLARLLKKNIDFRAIFLNRGVDLNKTKMLINTLGLSNHIVFLDEMTQASLKEYYCKADIVLNRVGLDGMPGLISFDAMSCGAPVISSLNPLFKKCYKETPPILSAFTEEEIYHQILKMRNFKERKDVGDSGRAWVEEYHNPDILVDRLISLYSEVYNGKGSYI